LLRLTNSNLLQETVFIRWHQLVGCCQAQQLNSSLDRACTLRDQKQEVDKMTNSDPMSLPAPAYAGGTKAITMTPIVGTPRREYAEMFVPGAEALEDGELRVTVLGSGNPWVTRGQASGSILVEVGNPERDLLLFDAGSGSLANYASLKLPVNLLDKVFFTHLHADHTADLITLAGSYAKESV
jgi:ribonuclease Z